ncbi:MAG: right-handed parallel beta-helix repeat-containing protein, partial [Flavisolibacter sp.]|nr:right-handed parallel beta-helix repeat-containing protein [Flavisolibacter sp.]
MKFWFNSITITLFLLFSFTSLAQINLDLKKDFRAKGDGKTDDTQAFLNAARKINELKTSVVLRIPKGNYIVHPQKPSSPESETPFLPVDVLYLKDCRNVSIVGEKGTVIRYAPPLYFGGFQKNKKGVQKLSKRTTDWKFRVAIGHGFNLESCSNVNISSIEIDGNNPSFILGGEFGDVGMQIDNDGAFIKDCNNISLSNLYLHHFGRDGILILNRTPQNFGTASQHISLTNCRFEYNGRQGFSWGGGVGLVATNCSFNYTGKSKFSSPPGAGVDFEPNAGYIVKDGVFNNCNFKNNSGVAVLADQGGFNVSNIRFKNCLIWGEPSAAIWVKSPAFSFEDCRINGCFYFGCAARTIDEGTKFTGCIFTDANSKNNYLVESNGSKYLLFDGCTFRASANGLLYIAANAAKTEERAVIKDCKFINLYTVPSKAGAFTTNTDFTGKTIFLDSSRHSRKRGNPAQAKT